MSKYAFLVVTDETGLTANVEQELIEEALQTDDVTHLGEVTEHREYVGVRKQIADNALGLVEWDLEKSKNDAHHDPNSDIEVWERTRDELEVAVHGDDDE